jgi:hypothetical protein
MDGRSIADQNKRHVVSEYKFIDGGFEDDGACSMHPDTTTEVSSDKINTRTFAAS